MLRNSLIAFAAAAVCVLHAPAHAQPATTTLRIQDYPGIGNFLVRVANANGLCEKHGVKCELRTIPQAPLAMQTLLAGDLEVAFTPPEVIVQAANKGADLKVIGSGARSPNFFLMAGAGLASPNADKGYPAVMQDFKGKKIGVTARGSAAEFQLVSLLKGAGMTAQDVTIVAVGSPNTAFPAISQKQVEGLMLFAPMDGFCEVTKACRMVVDPRKGQGPTDVLDTNGAAVLQVVRAEFLQKNPKAVEGFRQAMREAGDFAQNPANFGALLKTAQETFKISAPDGDKILEVSLRNSVPAFQFPVDAKAFQHAAQYMQRTGQIDKVVDTAKLLAQ
ncbi:PhnD/SsuA/transferrin family substrate-binding protein [Variovorax paradoxus]|uniref:PhnD/SsuA/transferrin family substrate-binding protein n=1 Tax=Variovorax paradoxus TaxID=34073 RepID=A0A5Q0M9M7_VARPD|nr:ABC transporter substrate-binding protein [Variovorax paradoxus]QFZ86209.1 PhnD/SsuA/transferrin family substrate-binding protein [Variovorax paradoxus]